MRFPTPTEGVVYINGGESRPLNAWNSSQPKVDSLGRHMHANDVTTFFTDGRRPINLRVDTPGAMEGLTPGSPVRLVDAFVEIYTKKDGFLGVRIEAAKIISVASPAKPTAS